jgi:hypothetical protein
MLHATYTMLEIISTTVLISQQVKEDTYVYEHTYIQKYNYDDVGYQFQCTKQMWEET